MAQQTITALYADGGVIGKNPSTIGITWAWAHVNTDNECINDDHGHVRCNSDYPTLGNNTAELLAVVNGLLSLPNGWTGTIYTDSANTIGRVRDNWKLNHVPEWLVEGLSIARSHVNLKGCVFVLLDGHPTAQRLTAGVGKRSNPTLRMHETHRHNAFFRTEV